MIFKMQEGYEHEIQLHEQPEGTTYTSPGISVTYVNNDIHVWCPVRKFSLPGIES